MRSPSGRDQETTTPFRPRDRRPERPRRRAARARRRRAPRPASSPRLPTNRASAPSAAAHAATFAACPPGADARLRRGVGARRERPLEAHDHVEEQVAERAEHGGIATMSMDGERRSGAALRSFVLGGLVGASAVLAAARRTRARAARATPPPAWPPSRTLRATARSSSSRRESSRAGASELRRLSVACSRCRSTSTVVRTGTFSSSFSG